MPSRRRSENDASLISRRALEEIFSEKPAANQSEYVPSVLLELRTVMTEGANVPQNRTYSTPPPDLPPWLIGNFRLPPWEARLLHMLFTFSRPVLMIRGGSGSGKTSTLKLIDRYCLKTFEAERRVFKNKYGFRSPLLPIELQSLSDELTTRYTRAEQIKQQVDQTFIEISELIDGALNDHMPWKEFGALFRDAVVVPTMPHQASASRISAVRAKLRTYIVDVIGKADYLKDGVGDSVSSQQAKMALARLEAPRDRLVARVLLLAEIGRSLKSTDDIPLTLVLDNVDPMPEYLQRKLFRELESIGFGLHPLFFRIAIFSRLSTAARYFKAGARAGAESIEEFHSPDPASLVAHQAARFLLAPKRFPQFQGLPVEEKSHISRRILMVWRYLQDPGGEFRKILSGLSGSNIRNAYLLTINWCLSPEWKKVGGSTDMNEISGAFKYACAAVFLNEIAESLRRGLRLSWTSEVIDGCRGRHSNDPPAVAEEIAKGTAEIFARLIADHRLARVAGDGDSFPETEKCIRSFFMRELRRNLLGILTPRKELDREFLRGILYALEKAGAELYETLSPEEFSLLLHEIKVSFADDLILGMEDAVGDGLLHKMETDAGREKHFPIERNK